MGPGGSREGSPDQTSVGGKDEVDVEGEGDRQGGDVIHQRSKTTEKGVI
jgi:hypothetical protein